MRPWPIFGPARRAIASCSKTIWLASKLTPLRGIQRLKITIGRNTIATETASLSYWQVPRSEGLNIESSSSNLVAKEYAYVHVEKIVHFVRQPVDRGRTFRLRTES